MLPDATHLLHVLHPRAVAEALAAFFARHPLPTRRLADGASLLYPQQER